jgi:hypothetical protein
MVIGSFVILAKARIQCSQYRAPFLDPRFRKDDDDKTVCVSALTAMVA